MKKTKYVDVMKGRLYGTKDKIGLQEGPINTHDLTGYLSTYAGHDVEIRIKPNKYHDKQFMDWRKKRGMRP